MTGDFAVNRGGRRAFNHGRNRPSERNVYTVREILPSDYFLDAAHRAAMEAMYEVSTMLLPNGVTFTSYRRRA